MGLPNVVGNEPTVDEWALRTVAMSWELDHVFFASADADAAETELAAFGFAFTVRRAHQGQGTANACAVFENAFFELLRMREPAELDSDLVRPLGLAERIRWRETGACPFGLCFRPTDTASDPESWPLRSTSSSRWRMALNFFSSCSGTLAAMRAPTTSSLVCLSLSVREPASALSAALALYLL